MRLHRILILVLTLTPIFQAYAGQSLHADCDAAPVVSSDTALDTHAHKASEAAHYQHAGMGHANADAAPVDSDTGASDCGCGCFCSAGHACQGGTALPASMPGYAPQRARVIPTQLDDHLPPAAPADDLRPPISLAR